VTPILALDPEQERLFWWTARERQRMLLRRQAGWPREEWTTDPVFRSHHFCNVFRRDDRVSGAVLRLSIAWGDCWAAALAGRLVNRHETIELLATLTHRASPFQLAEAIFRCGINTQAYRLNTPLGLNNHGGVVSLYERNLPLGPGVLDTPGGYLAGFVGYQIRLDLLEMQVPDTKDRLWAGPGCWRGAERLLGRKPDGDWRVRSIKRNDGRKDQSEVEAVMFTLLAHAPNNWPLSWRPWTTHEVEGWLCEYDKWARRHYNESARGRKYKGVYGVDYEPTPRRAT
jgi:hypothetical protein